MGESVFRRLPPDGAAVVFDGPGDGARDATAALQAAIDGIEAATGTGILFVPSGRYVLRGTVNLWRGIRLIGFGQTRPVFVLPDGAAGFEGPDSRYMVHFRDKRPAAGEDTKDAQNTTFYSGVWNIDFEVGDGNAGAVCCRYRVAQLCALKHIDFRVGGGKAAIEAVGNEVFDCRFEGGAFGIVTTNGTSAGWQTLLMNCVFTGQRVAGIETERCGLTISGCAFRDLPRGIVVREGKQEQLAVETAAFERVGVALEFEGADDLRNQINVMQARCVAVPVFLRFRDSERAVTLRDGDGVVRLHHGLQVRRDAGGGWHRQAGMTEVEVAPVSELGGDARGVRQHVPALPEVGEWVSVRDCGAVGDGVADDTGAFVKALARGRTVYVPMGRYRVAATLELPRDARLFGLHPQRTVVFVADGEAGWGDASVPRVIVRTGEGEGMLSGLGVYTGRNKGAVAVEWRGDGLLDDVWFDFGGHGADVKGEDALHTLVLAGGEGMVKNVWSPNILARDGLRVTGGAGRTYLVSVEHHRDVEVVIAGGTWTHWALQTEENLGSGGATAVEIAGADTTARLWNFFAYRVIAQTTGHPHAVRVRGTPREVVLNGVHVFSWGKYPFDAALREEATGVVVGEREIGRLVMAAACTPLLFLGDSLTAGEGVSAEESFVGRIAARVSSGPVVNGGRSGWASSSYVRRWAEVVPTIPADARTVVLQIGANDLRIEGHRPEALAVLRANVPELVRRIREAAPAAEVVLMTPAMIFPSAMVARMRESGFGEATPGYVLGIRDLYRELARELGVRLIDATGALGEGDTLDGAHPTAAGHAKLAAVVGRGLGVLGLES